MLLTTAITTTTTTATTTTTTMTTTTTTVRPRNGVAEEACLHQLEDFCSFVQKTSLVRVTMSPLVG